MGAPNWQLADYALAYDAVTRLAGATSEEEAIRQIFDLFETICNPEMQMYCRMHDTSLCELISYPQAPKSVDEIKKRLKAFVDDYAWTPSGNGFILKIRWHGETLGVLEIEGVHFPERKEEYLNLAVGLKDVLGLAISNARLFEHLEDRVEERTAAVCAAQSRIQLLLDSTAEGIFGLDLEGNCIFVNKSAAKMLGYSPDELLGKSVHYLVHAPEASGQSYPFEDCPVYKVLHGQEGIREHDSTFWTKGQCPLPVEYITNQIIQDGKVVGVVEIFTDITERKRIEEQLRRKEHDIRMAYADVFSAVTGGRLIFMTAEEVGALLGEPVVERGEITDYQQLSTVREEFRGNIARFFPDIGPIDELIVAISEALTNTVKHAGSGRYGLFKKDNTLQVWVHDSGSGIDFKTLPKATLLAGFSTKASLGMGFNIMLEICDRLLLATEPGSTTVVLEYSGLGKENEDILDVFSSWE